MKKQLNVHCSICDKPFSSTFSELMSWEYRCQECREGIIPKFVLGYTDNGNDDDE